MFNSYAAEEFLVARGVRPEISSHPMQDQARLDEKTLAGQVRPGPIARYASTRPLCPETT
jgi:hypothetical protein